MNNQEKKIPRLVELDPWLERALPEIIARQDRFK